MKVKLRNYRKNAKAITKVITKKKENIIKYYLMLILNLFTLILFPLRPIYSIVHKRMIANMKEYKEIGISKSFEAVDKPKIYWTYMIAFFAKGFLFLGILIVHGVLAFMMHLLGSGVYSLLSDVTPLIQYIFILPVAVSLLYFLLTIRYRVCPTSYILERNPEIKTSSAIYLSFECTKKAGKRTLFANDFLHLLKLILFIAVPSLIISYISQEFNPNIGTPLCLFLLAISMFLFFVLEAKSGYKWELIKYNIYDDLITDYLAKDTLVSGIRFKEIKQNDNINETLLSVFENANEFDEKAKKAIHKIPEFSDKLGKVSVSANVVEAMIKQTKESKEPIILDEKAFVTESNVKGKNIEPEFIPQENVDFTDQKIDLEIKTDNDLVNDVDIVVEQIIDESKTLDSLSEHTILESINDKQLSKISLKEQEEESSIDELLGLENPNSEFDEQKQENIEEVVTSKKVKKSFFSMFRSKSKEKKQDKIVEENIVPEANFAFDAEEQDAFVSNDLFSDNIIETTDLNIFDESDNKVTDEQVSVDAIKDGSIKNVVEEVVEEKVQTEMNEIQINEENSDKNVETLLNEETQVEVTINDLPSDSNQEEATSLLENNNDIFDELDTLETNMEENNDSIVELHQEESMEDLLAAAMIDVVSGEFEATPEENINENTDKESEDK